jgi:hypothetical protein
MSCDIKVQSAFEHDRWVAHKSADRLKGKRVPRCACSWCASARIPSSRGGNGRICPRIDDHEIDGITLGARDVEDEFFMEAVHASTNPTSTRAARSAEVPLTALIREPRRRKGMTTPQLFRLILLTLGLISS